MFSKIHNFIQKRGLIQNEAFLIVGLSGGPDSVFLLHLLASLQKEKNLKLIAAHLDHAWRPESAHDAQFCQEIAAKYGVPLITKTMKELNLNIKFNGSKEEIGRKARRHFFESIAKEYGASAIALAHHADDQMETVFIRMMRGASLAGLAGMKPKDNLYIRPLLQTKKEEIEAFLDEHAIPYRIDPTNASSDFLRNRIRTTVIPALRDCDSRFEQNFTATHAHLQETEEFLNTLAQKTLQDLNGPEGISIQALLELHPILRNRILIGWLIAHKVPFTPSQGLLDEIIRFLEQPGNGEHTFYGKWSMRKKQGNAAIF